LPQERLSMRKIKETLRLHSLGLKQQHIATSCAIAQSTVCDYLRAAQVAGLSWPEMAGLDERELTARLFPERAAAVRGGQYPPPDFAAIHQELQTHKHLTMQLLWEEYRQGCPNGYRYSRFCELYQRWRARQDVVLRQQHRAGEKVFIDWAGDTVPVYDRQGGEPWPVSIFVAVLGASSYTFAQPRWTQTLPDWIGAHLDAFEFFGGVPEIAVPDNPKTGVSKACRYEPDLNRTYQEMAAHYGIAVVPARPAKPRDKAKVEAAVLVVERILASKPHPEMGFRSCLGILRLAKQYSSERMEAAAERALLLNACSYQSLKSMLARGLDRPLVRSLTAESVWVRERQNVFLLGPTGIGKTWLARAFGHKACRDGYTAYFTKATELFRDLGMARADGSLRKLLYRLSRVDVLIVDDWAMAPLAEGERREFLEICDERYPARSTLLTSQLPVSAWHAQIGDPTVADSILDRLVHNAHRLELSGESLRKQRARKPGGGE